MSAQLMEAHAELSRLLDLVEQGRGRPMPLPIHELTMAYSDAIDRLARARADGAGDDVLGTLNDLVARAARVLHGPKPYSKRDLGFLRSLPGQLKAAAGPLIVAFMIVLGGLLAGFCSIGTGSKIVRLVAPPEQLAIVDGYLQGGVNGSMPELLSPALLHHHVGVAVVAIATGLLFGVGPTLLLFWAGLQAGALGMVYLNAGAFGKFLAWFLPYGLPGLAIVTFSGAAGLAFGWAMIAPGLVSRRSALAHAGRQASALAAAAFIFILAELVLVAIF